MSRIRFTEQADPATPAADRAELFVSTGAPGNLKIKKDDGSVVDLEAGGGVTDHGALTGLADDDHAQYQLRTEKNSASGYAGLDGSSKLAGAQQTYGAASNTACVGNDARLSDARTPLAHTHPLADITDEGALAALNTVGTPQIDNDSVTYAKIQNVSVTDRLLGRSTAGAGDVEEIACTGAGRALIDDATAGDQRTTLGLGALATLGTVGSAQIDAAAVTYAKIQDISAASRLLGRGSAAGAGDVEEIVLGTNLSMSGATLNATGGGGPTALDDLTDVTITTPATGAVLIKSAGDWVDGQVDLADSDAVTGLLPTGNIADGAVTFPKMQDIATDRLIGRDTAATGDPEELTVTGGVEFTGSGGIQRSALTGDVTATAGSNATTIANDAVTYAKLQNVAGFSVPGKATTGSGDAADITAADETVLGRTGAGNLAFAALATGQIANDAVTYSKLQNVAGFSVVGKASTGSGDAADITAADETVLGRTAAGNVAFAALATGQVANNAITYAKLQDVAGFSVPGKATTGSGDAADITAADATVLGRTGGGNVAFGQVQTDQIANDAVTYAKIQTVTDARLIGRSAGSNGDAQEITVGSGLSLSGGALTATGGGALTTVKLGSDQTVGSTTPEDVTGLSFSLAASTTYGFEFVICWRSDTATVGAGFAVNGPTSPTIIVYDVQIESTQTAAIHNGCRAYDSFPATTLTVDTINVDYITIIKGLIVNAGNTGTLIVRHRLETGSAAINTVKAGSFGLLYTL